MTDDATNWVTVKIPETVRDEAREDERTYGDIMLAGLEVPSDDLRKYEDLVRTVEQAIGEAIEPDEWATDGNGNPVFASADGVELYPDADIAPPDPSRADELASEVASNIDYAELASKTARKTAKELEELQR